MGRTTYMGFFVDWTLNWLFVVAPFLILNTTSSIYIGIFLYIDGMVKDMKMRLMLSEDEPKESKVMSYVQEIEFHIKIVWYFLLY